MHDRRLPLADDLRQLPRGGEVDLAARRKRDEIRPFARAAEQLTVAMRDEHGPMPALTQPDDGQEDLLLSSAPRARGVDVEGEHSSQSFANLRPTYRAFIADTISPGTPSVMPPRRM